MGNELEKYVENGRTRELYQTAKKITTKQRCQVEIVKNNRGEIGKDENSRLERWAEHFEEVLVREAATNPIDENEVETNEISEMGTKSGRTPGIDGIPTRAVLSGIT